MKPSESCLVCESPAAVEQEYHFLSARELHPFVQYFFSRKNKYLEAVSKYSPPLYVLEPEVLAERAVQFRTVFSQKLPDVSFYYAVKSNNHPDVAGNLIASGFGLDVSSGLELEMALGLGCQDIIFSGPGKTAPELRLAVEHADRLVVLLDSFNEMSRLEELAAAQNKTVRVGVRLTTTETGLWRKFGIPPQELLSFWIEASKCNHLVFQGVQFHTSWNLSPAAQVTFIKVLGGVLAGLPAAARKDLKFIDIGGGYWPPQGEWLQAAGTTIGARRKAFGLKPGSTKDHYHLPAYSLKAFAEQVSQAIHKYLLTVVPCRICFEPGRWICNDAMHLLISVVDKKGSDLVITDAGTSAVGWERFETDYFPVLNLSRPAMEENTCDILGSLCTPHDVWGYNYWGREIEIGDILMIPTQGAYTYSLRQNFIKPVPEVVTV